MPFAEVGVSEGPVIADADVPRLPRGVRLRRDEARNAWVLLAPERILQPDGVALEILTRIDGTASLAEIVDSLADAFAAEREEIDADVRSFLAGLAAKGFVEFGR